MRRVFKEPATTWRGAFARASTWAAPQLCGSYALGSLFEKPMRHWMRVGLASAGIAAVVVATAFVVVLVVIRTSV